VIGNFDRVLKSKLRFANQTLNNAEDGERMLVERFINNGENWKIMVRHGGE
jgi:hypothetical protein